MSGSKLKIDIRRDQILEQLRREGSVSVTQLSSALAVTPVTIRNDLAALEREGYLTRIQGGAVQKLHQPEEWHAVQEVKFVREKQAIAEAVAQMIRDGDTLFINSGTTTQYIAAALHARRNLNIVTNSLAVATALGDVPSFRVLLLGGEIDAQYGFTYGSDALDQLSRYQADWAILSVDGISARGGITTHHAQEAVIDRMMAEGAANRLIAADRSKIGRAGFTRVCECSGGFILVTNTDADGQTLEQLADCAVRIVYA